MLSRAMIALLLLTTGAGWAEPVVTVAAVGDVQLGRGVGRRVARQGVDYPFARVQERIRGADVALLNLECALSAEGQLIAKRYSFRADPEAAGGLARAGFDLAVLANNHSLDCGRGAFAETRVSLEKYGRRYVGAGENAREAEAPLFLTVNGLRLAVLARTEHGMDGLIYREDAPTVARLDPETIVEEVRAARREAEVVIVSLHWGVEYAHEPQEWQRQMAHALIDAGATLVVGHHPHTPQPVERYKTGLIAYSLGNLVFDPIGEGGRHGLLLTCTLTREGVRDYDAIPVEIVEMQPRVR
jgi:poly-gamma-glutamate synthesis protein (capsule biosynthesis protein)